MNEVRTGMMTDVLQYHLVRGCWVVLLFSLVALSLIVLAVG